MSLIKDIKTKYPARRGGNGARTWPKFEGLDAKTIPNSL